MSTLSEQIFEDMKTAMKAKESDRVTVLRGLLSALKNAAIEKGGGGGASNELEEVEVVAAVRKQVKQREDSITMYEEAGRKELADKERSEVEMLSVYLPAPLDEAELCRLVDEAISKTGAESRKDMGAVMAVLKESTAGRVDSKTLSGEVMKRLS